MKRDMELVRELLLEVEKQEPNTIKQEVEYEDDKWTGEEVMGHLNLLNNRNLIAGTVIAEEYCIALEGLTWEGHDFLDSIRDEGVWKKVKSKLATVGGGATLEIVKTLGVKYAKEKLGLDN